jgi:hypothetical protein
MQQRLQAAAQTAGRAGVRRVRDKPSNHSTVRIPADWEVVQACDG